MDSPTQSGPSIVGSGVVDWGVIETEAFSTSAVMELPNASPSAFTKSVTGLLLPAARVSNVSVASVNEGA